MYVYVITAARCERAKIGISASPRTRLRALQLASPDALEIRVAIRCRNRQGAERLEAQLHAKFADYRTHGEWFASPDGSAFAAWIAQQPRVDPDDPLEVPQIVVRRQASFAEQLRCAQVALEYGLTTRERQLFELLCLGHETRDAAQLLGLTNETAKTYCRGIRDKVGCKRKRWRVLSAL